MTAIENKESFMESISWIHCHSEMKVHLKNNPLIIRVYDEDIEIGTVNVNLMELYENESFKGTQQSFTEKFQI